MPRKKREISYHERLVRLRRSGMRSPLTISLSEGGLNKPELKDADSLSTRVLKLINWLQTFKREKGDDMLYFIMYDISDNKVRNHIAKYLIRRGCMRVQKSVYLARSRIGVFKEICTVLKEVNEVYQNEDSIMVLPVSEDKLHAMKVIGKNVDYELVCREENVIVI